MRLAKIDDYPNIKKMLENVSDTSDIMFKAGVDIDHIQEIGRAHV